jgi:hypothetical protein
MAWPYTKTCPRCKGAGEIRGWLSWLLGPAECGTCEGGGWVNTWTYLAYLRLRRNS